MKTTLYYFSGTGNSLAICQDLAKELDDCEIVSIAKKMQEQDGDIVLDSKCVGIIFPVYMFGLPVLVKEFVERLRGEAFVFSIANSGGMPAASLNQMAKILKKNKMKLSSGYLISMPGNYTPMYGAPAIEKQEKMFKKQKQKIEKIVKDVKELQEKGLEKTFFLINWLFSGIFYRLGAPRIRKMDEKYSVDPTCNSCEICKKVCPVNNIEMEAGKPKWLHKCEQCMACLQWCPQEAIQFGKNTRGRKRYHHPDINVNDFFIR